jgi:hypothetical protein
LIISRRQIAIPITEKIFVCYKHKPMLVQYSAAIKKKKILEILAANF